MYFVEVLKMEIRQAERLDHFKTGIFASLNEEKDKLIAQGRKVYNLFIGTPDFVPSQHVVDALVSAAKDPENWKYALKETDELLGAVCDYYKDRFGVEPKVKAIHAGLECGLVGDKIAGMDMISFGPTLRGVHSPDERIEIPTVQKFWDLLKDILVNAPRN